jgi:hypothetical protein
VRIVKAASLEETADWMQHNGAKSSTCRVQPYSFGDEAYLHECSGIRKSVLNYRKDHFLVVVRGDSQTLVERFAKYTLKVLPAT